ncbi:hypothetical protein IJG28_00450 [Candidatus Saccharibacteria bacterium]|nr:hypothetical protein [Candidatus Saccharibacteria bacterium]
MEKHFLLLMLLGIYLLTLASCDEESPQKSAAAQPGNTTQVIDSLMSEINDADFWGSASLATTLVRDSIEEDQLVTVIYRLETSSEERFVSEPRQIGLDGEGKEWRDLIYNQLMCWLATSDDVANAHKAGESIQVTGVLINWSERKSWFNKDLDYFTACDLDADGVWDYACDKTTTFTGVPHFFTPDFELTDVEMNDLVPIDKKATLSELRRIAH